jgi:hypothetical protein
LFFLLVAIYLPGDGPTIALNQIKRLDHPER